jgi:streptogramin lyase
MLTTSVKKANILSYIQNVAGSTDTSGFTNGTGSAATFKDPSGMVIDGSSNIYVADTGNHAIRKITPGRVVTTYAGTGSPGNTNNATGTLATFNLPRGLAIDASSNIYVADTGNDTVRKIAPTSGHPVTTILFSVLGITHIAVNPDATKMIGLDSNSHLHFYLPSQTSSSQDRGIDLNDPSVTATSVMCRSDGVFFMTTASFYTLKELNPTPNYPTPIITDAALGYVTNINISSVPGEGSPPSTNYTLSFVFSGFAEFTTTFSVGTVFQFAGFTGDFAIYNGLQTKTVQDVYFILYINVPDGGRPPPTPNDAYGSTGDLGTITAPSGTYSGATYTQVAMSDSGSGNDGSNASIVWPSTSTAIICRTPETGTPGLRVYTKNFVGALDFVSLIPGSSYSSSNFAAQNYRGTTKAYFTQGSSNHAVYLYANQY